MNHDQVKMNKLCSLCNTNSYIEFIRIFCGHILCDKCMISLLGEGKIYCPECKDSFNINLCYRVTREVKATNQIKSPPSPSISESQILKLKGSINSFTSMISQIRQLYIGCDTQYSENQSNVLKFFEKLKQRIESNQKIVLDKIREIKEINQKYLVEWRDLLNKEMSKRKELINEVEMVRSGIENSELIKKISEIQDFPSQTLYLSKFKFGENHEETIEKFILENLSIFSIIMENFTVEWKSQDYIEEEVKEKGKISGHVMEVENRDSYNNLEQYPKKGGLDERNHPHPGCKWFIEVGDDIKQLPLFVCDQIDKFRTRKNFIFILKAGIKINFVDLEKRLYYSADANGSKSNPHRLIYIPSE